MPISVMLHMSFAVFLVINRQKSKNLFYVTSFQQEADENLSFDEMILEAAKSIAAATSALVKAASAAQRELIDTGKVN